MSDNSSGGQIISTNTDTSQLPSSSSQGYRIGGGGAVSANETELTASPGAVRQTLRDFWGSKFDAKSGTSVTQPLQSKVKEEDKKSPKAKCPGDFFIIYTQWGPVYRTLAASTIFPGMGS